MKQRQRSAVLAFAEHIQSVQKPQEIINRLNDEVATLFDLNALAAWRVPHNPEGPRNFRFGENTFLHQSVPPSYSRDYLASYKEHGPSLMARKAWLNRGPFTFTEAMRDVRDPADRWIFDFLAKHGIRDGFYVPQGAWMILFSSRRQLLHFDHEVRAILNFAAGEAAFRLEALLGKKLDRGDHDTARPKLSARQVTMLRDLSNGRTIAEIAETRGITEPSARTHLRRAAAKLKARTAEHAVALAIRGLVMRSPLPFFVHLAIHAHHHLLRILMWV